MNKAPVTVTTNSTPASPGVTNRTKLRGVVIAEAPVEKTCSPANQEEPPGKRCTGRESFFPNVPDICWNDWKWHFRNRITTIEQLGRYIPLSLDEKLQLETVINRYPLAITPYYLSLINPYDPYDPIRQQAVPSETLFPMVEH